MERCLDGDTILTTVREPLILLNQQLRVQSASRSFLETFQVSAEETLHERIFDVGCGQWNFPEMHRLLHFGLRAEGGGFREVIIDHDFQRIGHRVLQINCCRLNRDTDNLILLAVNEIGPAQAYRRLFDSASDGLLIAGVESGGIIDANQSMINLLGSDREQLIGRLFWEIDPLIASPLGRDGFERIRAEGLVQFPIVVLRDRYGRLIETEVTGSISDREFAHFNFRDVTQRRRNERQLQAEARQMGLGVLAGGIAHNFNNLLAVILGYATLALDDAPEESRLATALNSVIRAGRRAADLTRQMLVYAGQERAVLRRINVSEIVREAGSLVAGSVPKPVTLEFDLAAEPLFVNADVRQMKELIANLMTNAAEAVLEGKSGHVTIATRLEYFDEDYIGRNVPDRETSPGTYVIIEVSDSGSGMDVETQARIFDPFFSTRFTGRGLGLAAALGIAKGHGGSILVNSHTGGGTTFRVFLPCPAPRNEPDRAAPVMPQVPSNCTESAAVC
jgi:two-component system CheB/CheR fusion protein